MANYRVKSAAGPWTAGQIISDEDIKAWPAGGGVERLRDLGSIEDTYDTKPGEKPDLGSVVEHGGATPENTTGNTKKGASTAAGADADGPNARGHRAGGRS